MLAYFPLHYADARERFRALCEKIAEPKSTETWPIPSATDQDLSVDTLFLPPTSTPEKLFVLMSGVHGLEAYAGHALQEMFLKEVWPKIDRRHTGVLVVHGLNPFGFKHHRRGTEANVNLNRNCSIHDDLYKIKNEASLQLSDRFVPKQPVNSEKCFLLQQLRREGEKIYFADVPMDDFIKNVGLGQFASPSGLEFGGFKAEPQIEQLTLALRRIIPDYQDLMLFDLHTGLGERGRLHLLTGDAPGCVNSQLFKEIFKVEEDRALYDAPAADQEGFYHTYGATNDLFPELIRSDQRVCAMTMEFGTLGHSMEAQLESLNQWLLEHQGSLYGYATEALKQKVQDNYLERFFPQDPAWRNQILNTSREFFLRVLSRSKVLL